MKHIYFVLPLIALLLLGGCLNIDEQKNVQKETDDDSKNNNVSEQPDTSKVDDNPVLEANETEEDSNETGANETEGELSLRVDSEYYETKSTYVAKIVSNADRCYQVIDGKEVSLDREFVISEYTTYVAEFKESPSHIVEKEVSSEIECVLGSQRKLHSFTWIVDTKPPVLPDDKDVEIEVDDVSYTKRELSFHIDPATDFSALRYRFKGTIELYVNSVLLYANTTEQNSSSNNILLTLKIPSHSSASETYVINGDVEVFDSKNNKASYKEIENERIEI